MAILGRGSNRALVWEHAGSAAHAHEAQDHHSREARLTSPESPSWRSPRSAVFVWRGNPARGNQADWQSALLGAPGAARRHSAKAAPSERTMIRHAAHLDQRVRGAFPRRINGLRAPSAPMMTGHALCQQGQARHFLLWDKSTLIR